MKAIVSPPLKSVNVTWQLFFIFIPFLNIWAMWRIQKLGRALLLFIPMNLVVAFFTRMAITYGYSLDDRITGLLLGIVALSILAIVLSAMVHFVNIWSNEWNKKITKAV